MPSLKDKTVLVIGRGSGIARAIALAVGEDGGRVIAAGRHPDDLADAYRGMDIGIEHSTSRTSPRSPRWRTGSRRWTTSYPPLRPAPAAATRT